MIKMIKRPQEYIEAVTQGCKKKKFSYIILRNSLVNTCAGVSFLIKKFKLMKILKKNSGKLLLGVVLSIKVQKQPPELFCKKGVPKYFAKFTGKHLCHSLFFNKLVGYSGTGVFL